MLGTPYSWIDHPPHQQAHKGQTITSLAFTLRSLALYPDTMDEPTIETPLNRPTTSQTAAADAAPRCGAKGKRTGKPCRAPAMANGRCHKHGGATPSGIASSQFVHGRKSRHLPPGLLSETAEQSRARGQAVLSLMDDLHDQEGRLAELRQALNDEGNVRANLRALSIRAAAPDATIADILPDLQQIATAIESNASVWRQWMDHTRHKADLITVEMKRQTQARELADRDQVSAIILSMLRLFVRHCPEPERRAALDHDLHREIPLIMGRTQDDQDAMQQAHTVD